MKNIFAPLALFILLPLLSSAQTNFKPGYIVNLSGDTVKGSVDYKDWNNNPKTITFKSNTEEKIYDPKSINGFGVNGIDHYKSFTGKISRDRIESNNISTGIDTSFKIETVFLRILTKGKNVSLLFYNDDIKERYFFTDRTGQTNELVYRIYIDNSIKRNTVITDNKFRQQLHLLRIAYQPNDNKLIDIVQNTKYTSGSLSQTIIKLNGSEASSEVLGVNRSRVRYFASAGVGINNPASPTSSTSIGPAIATGLDIIFNKHTGKTAFRAELGVTSNSIKNRIDYSAIIGFPYIDNLNFTQHVISFTPQLLYHFYNKDNFKIYAGAGLAINYALYSGKEYYIVSGSNTTHYNFPDVQTFFLAPAVKIGSAISDKFGVHVSYLPSTPLGNNFDLDSYRAAISYYFN